MTKIKWDNKITDDASDLNPAEGDKNNGGIEQFGLTVTSVQPDEQSTCDKAQAGGSGEYTIFLPTVSR